MVGNDERKKIVLADPPEIEIEQNWYQREEDVIEVELICIVHAIPRAEVSGTVALDFPTFQTFRLSTCPRPFSQVSWYRRQKKLHETDRQLFQRKTGRETLHITQVDAGDFGNYSCKAENVLGKARTYTSLTGGQRKKKVPLHGLYAMALAH